MKNETILITGGAGYLGSKLIERLYKDNRITVYSRDAKKHKELKERFPKLRCIQGNIGDETLLAKALKGHTVAIFAASIKRIEEVDKNVKEASRNIIDGALNSRNAAIKNKLKAAFFISTDKSRMPTTLYGAMKLIAGEAFIANAEMEKTKLNTIVCGNIINSTGSILPLIWSALEKNTTLSLFGKEMTRFLMTPEEVLAAISLGMDKTGYNIIPKLRSFKVKDLFEIYEKKFGLMWKLGEPRLGEKIHEQMISPHELPRTTFDKKHNTFLIHYRIQNQKQPVKDVGRSDKNLISKKALEQYLKKNNFFKPLP